MNELTREQLEELSTELTGIRDDLLQTMQQTDESAQPVELDQQAFGRVSRVDALQQQSMAKASHVQCQEQLRQVIKSLARMDSGDFGYCLNCDALIGYARLKARPETSFCLKCQTEREANR